MNQTRWLLRAVCPGLLPLALGACAHMVVLDPQPDMTAGARLPLTASVAVGQVEATVHPGIPIKFELRPAIISYVKQRQTFQQVVDGPADVTLRINPRFIFATGGQFSYTFLLRASLAADAKGVIGQYFGEATATGSVSRFTAASDQGPTNAALAKALDSLFAQIEADHAQILAKFRGESPAQAAAPEPARESRPAVPVSDVDAPRYKKDERPQNYALVIGIEKYQNLPAADFAEHDAAAVRSHLRALGYPERNIIYLTGAKASRTGIEKYVETWLPLNVKEDSRLFVYFSGHGAPDPATGQAYLVPWDGDAKFLKNTGYPVKQLYRNLNALKAKTVILAMDACFSVLAKGARPLVTRVDAGVESGGKLVVLAAAAGDEITGTEEKEGHGLFTYHLLKELGDKDGDATIRGLYQALLPRVQDAARRDGRDQTPQLLPADVGAKAAAGLR
jgi:hypothetical protein